jgi:excinuclease ABC subunit A
VDLADPPKLNRKLNHDVSIVVDRLVVKKEDRGRLTDSVETALRLAEGLAEIVRHDGPKAATQMFSEKYGCPTCGISMPELEPRHFSFNSPFGACATCSGLGTKRTASPELILGDPTISILEGVILPWGEPDGYLRRVILPALAKQLKFELNTPWGKLPDRVKFELLFGTQKKKGEDESRWEGILSNVQRRYSETTSDAIRGELEAYMVVAECPDCNGRRLKKESLAVTIHGRNIGEFTECSAADALAFALSVPVQGATASPGSTRGSPVPSSRK